MTQHCHPVKVRRRLGGRYHCCLLPLEFKRRGHFHALGSTVCTGHTFFGADRPSMVWQTNRDAHCSSCLRSRTRCVGNIVAIAGMIGCEGIYCASNCQSPSRCTAKRSFFSANEVGERAQVSGALKVDTCRKRGRWRGWGRLEPSMTAFCKLLGP